MASTTKRGFVKGAATTLAASFLPMGCDNAAVKAQYDYVIIGGGSAGCVLARRLSDNPKTRVLLIEAGGPADHPAVDDGLRWFSMLGSALAYPDMTTPQPGLGGKQIFAAHGKALGGSSVINAMIHHWPTPGDLDGWGLARWGWRDIAPMLKRSETFLGGGKTRGSDGPIKVSALPDPPPLADAAMEAGRAQGLGTTADINSGDQMGVGLNQLAYGEGKRQHTGAVYIAPIEGRENLTIMLNTPVQRLTLDAGRCTGAVIQTADGVAAITGGTTLLSAGALRTPQLLMLSGIGPADHLRTVGLDVALDQGAIGSNLHDHLLFSGNNFSANAVTPSKVHGSVAVLYGSSVDQGGARDILCNISTSAQVFPPLESAKVGFKTSFSFTKPHSRGQVRLASASAAETPLLDHRFFTDERDVTGALAALALSQRLLTDTAFAKFEPQQLNMDMLSTPGGRRAFLNASATSFGHHAGTCKMGDSPNDPVDQDLALRGIEGLRVVDASLIPFLPSSPTNALVVAMAELAASRMA